MISLLLEKLRKQAQKTVLGVEFDKSSLAAVKLDKSADSYKLVGCDSDFFHPEAYFEGELSTDYVGSVIANVISENKLGRFVKLGFTSYNEIDVSKEDVICDKKALEVIKKEGASFYISEIFLKRKYPDNYKDIAYDYNDDIEEKGVLSVYYIPDLQKMQQLSAIAKKTKKALAVCTLDSLAITNFVQHLFLSELSKSTSDSIFLGLYSDKLSVYSFTKSGELKNHEIVKIFDPNISDANYVDEAIQLLLRFMDFMSLDFSDNDFDSFGQNQDNDVYIYGLKQNFENIFKSIQELSQKQCKILNPFVNIEHESYGEIDNYYRYVIPVAIAMYEAL